MDKIDIAIAKGWHKTEESHFKGQTWESFRKETRGKKLYVFGIAEALDFILNHTGLDIEAVIDSDERKQGLPLSDFADAAKPLSETKVLNPEILKEQREDLAVLISTSRYYEEVGRELEESGVTAYYSVLVMEAQKRGERKIDVNEAEREITRGYVEESLKLPIEPKKIVFYTMGTYAGHGKYIIEQLLKKRSDLDVVWLVHDLKAEVPAGIRKVYANYAQRYIRELETAAIWVYDRMIPTYIVKRPGQTYIQTKHWASVTLKTFGVDMKKFRGEQAGMDIVEYNGRMMDYLITGSDFDTRTCKQGYMFDGEVLEYGSPRSDALFRPEEYKEKVCARYGIDPKKKLLLYAPTFRCRQDSYYVPESKVDLDFEMTKKALDERFGGDWQIILRLHPTVCVQSRDIVKPPFVTDASFYPDSQELVAACDITITDYSSLMFEPAFVRKPVFLFATDKADYINVERELLIDYETLPFPIAESNEELAEVIRSFEYEPYKAGVDGFMERYGVHEDGHAGERAAEFINTLLGK